MTGTEHHLSPYKHRKYVKYCLFYFNRGIKRNNLVVNVIFYQLETRTVSDKPRPSCEHLHASVLTVMMLTCRCGQIHAQFSKNVVIKYKVNLMKAPDEKLLQFILRGSQMFVWMFFY